MKSKVERKEGIRTPLFFQNGTGDIGCFVEDFIRKDEEGNWNEGLGKRWLGGTGTIFGFYRQVLGSD